MSNRKLTVLLTALVLTLDVGVSTAWAWCQANELAKLHASDGAPIDRFGGSVAICGDHAFVAAPDDDNENGVDAGSVYVFWFDGQTWVEQAKLLPSDGAAGDSFGVHVACSGDTAVVSAHYDDDNGDQSGSAYVFVKPPGGWDSVPSPINETAKLLPSDGAAQDYFGTGVAISGDTVVIGAAWDDNENGIDAGAAYVFVPPPDGWGSVPPPINEAAKLTASDGAPDDELGTNAAICGDIAIVGASMDDDNGTSSGSAYVFEKPPTGWEDMTETQKLIASDGAAGDHFGGNAVACCGDTAVIAAFFDDSSKGSAYVFQCEDSSWVEKAKLLASDGAAWDWFGYSVAISGDTVVVGAVQYYSNGLGAGYVFKKPPGGWDSVPSPMNEDAKLLGSDSVTSDDFGNSVAIWDGTAVIGAFEDDDNGPDSGSAYVFRGLSDCQPNDTLDICDIAEGTSQDVNGDGIPDECEIKRPMAEDCDTIAPGTRCDVDGGAHPCVTDADCAWESHCVPAPVDQPELGNVCYAPKTRYISIARNPEQVDDTARRIKLSDGTELGWVGPPSFETPVQEPGGLWVANVVGAPHYETVWPDVVHVYCCPIAHASLSDVTEQHCNPNPIAGENCVHHSYHIQAIVMGADTLNEANYSEVLELKTNTTWGDTVTSGPGGLCMPPDGVPGLADIMAAINTFQGTYVAPITWMDIGPSNSDDCPERYVGLTDTMACIAGFQGSPYPGLGPKNCGASSAHIVSYSNSGCLPGSDGGRDYVWCPDDEIELTVGPGTLHVLHKNATYWCAQEDIVITLAIEGNVLKLTEKEINPEPTDCLCCYNVEATVVNLAPGEYTVEFCWNDYESGWEQVCYVENIVIP